MNPKMQEVIGGWRKLFKEERHDYFVHINKYCEGYQIQGRGMGTACGVKGRENKCM